MQNQRKRTKKVMNSFQKDYCSIDFLVQKIYPFGGTAETIEPCTFDALWPILESINVKLQL